MHQRDGDKPRYFVVSVQRRLKKSAGRRFACAAGYGLNDFVLRTSGYRRPATRSVSIPASATTSFSRRAQRRKPWDNSNFGVDCQLCRRIPALTGLGSPGLGLGVIDLANASSRGRDIHRRSIPPARGQETTGSISRKQRESSYR